MELNNIRFHAMGNRKTLLELKKEDTKVEKKVQSYLRFEGPYVRYEVSKDPNCSVCTSLFTMYNIYLCVPICREQLTPLNLRP